MLSSEGMQLRKTVKTTIGLISKSNFARAEHCLSCLAVWDQTVIITIKEGIY